MVVLYRLYYVLVIIFRDVCFLTPIASVIFFLFYNWTLPLRTSYVRYPLLRRQPTERGIAYHNGILNRDIPLPWRQPPEGVSPFNYVNPQSGYPSFWRNPTLPRRQPTEGWPPPLFVASSHREGGSIKFWVTIFSLQCLSYVFDDGYAPGSQWSVLMMEFHNGFLFSSFDGEITVP